MSKGTLEVFPNRSDTSKGMGLRLPLQPGFAWLNKHNLQVEYERSELTAGKALEFFLDYLESDANSFADFRKLKSHVQELEARKAKAIAHADPTYSNIVPIRRTADNLQPSEFTNFVALIFGQLPPGIIADNWYKGRLFFHHGLAGPSQRAEALICVGHYIFYGDPSLGIPPLGYGYEQEREWALERFITSRHNGQSKDINDGRADALAQVQRAANWTPPHRKGIEATKYAPVRPISWIKENQNRQKDARTRIQDALDALKKQNRAFTTVELHELAQCSRETLYKHKDIWRAVYDDRKNYRDLSAGFFANCTDEYNDVVGADSSKIKPPTTGDSKITPPGLLAARQIAQEISMRSQRDMRRNEKQKAASELASSSDWSDKVASLTTDPPASLTIERLKLLLVVLAHYLSIAPSKEDEEVLVSYIKQLRSELDSRNHPPRLLPDYG